MTQAYKLLVLTISKQHPMGYVVCDRQNNLVELLRQLILKHISLELSSQDDIGNHFQKKKDGIEALAVNFSSLGTTLGSQMEQVIVSKQLEAEIS